MICYLNGQEIELSKRIGSGIEGVVYRYQDKAIKIYKNYRLHDRKTEIRDKILKSLETNRIMIPEELVTDEYGFYLGYSIPFIPKNVFRRKSVDIPSHIAIKNFRLLEKDSVMLANNFVLMDDTIHNVIDNGTLYFIDSGYYRFIDKDSYNDNIYISQVLGVKDNINLGEDLIKKALTIKNLDLCYSTIWANIEKKIIFRRNNLNNLKLRVINAMHDEPNKKLSDVIERYIKPEESIRNYVKRML